MDRLTNLGRHTQYLDQVRTAIPLATLAVPNISWESPTPYAAWAPFGYSDFLSTDTKNAAGN